MGDVEVCVLGPLRLVVDGHDVAIASPIERRLLLRLVVDAPRPVSGDALADAIWGDHLPADPANAIRYHVWKLRKDIGESGTDLLVTAQGGYALNVDSERIDSARFLEEVAAAGEALASDSIRAEAITATALARWRGAPFADAEDAEFAQPEVRRLLEAHRVAHEVRARALADSGRSAEAIPLTEGLLQQYPLSERLWGALMIALYREGRQGEALRAYQRARAVLGEELGIEPTPELRALEEQLLLQDPSLRTSSATPSNVPATLTPLVGRAEELEAVRALIEEHRLVSIVGVGGAGKTRLAVEAARTMLDRFRDGVWFIDLTRLVPTDDVFAAVERAMGLSRKEEVLSSAQLEVERALAGRTALLVLDNCEHVLDDGAMVAAHVLAHSTDVHVVVTSRTPLAVPGERIYPIPVLALPDEDADGWDAVIESAACRLFVERARAGGALIDETDATAALVAAICHRVEGLPLAIELAAARVRSTGLPRLAAQIAESLGALGTQRTPDERHRTIDATIAWSHELLGDQERLLFDRLGVFVGGFTEEAASVVCGRDPLSGADVPVLLSDLVVQSMVEHSAHDGRYRLLEPFRLFALDRLGEHVEDVRDWHAEYYLDLAAQMEGLRRGPEKAGAAGIIAAESANVRSVLARLSQREAWGELAALVAALEWFWAYASRLEEADRWVPVVLAHADGAHPAHLARVRLLHAYLAGNGRRPFADGVAAITDAVRLAGETDDPLLNLDIERFILATEDLLHDVDPELYRNSARALLDVAERYRELGDEVDRIDALVSAGYEFMMRGAYDEAEEAGRRAEAIARRLSVTADIAASLMLQAHVALTRARSFEHTPGCEQLLIEAIALAEQAGIDGDRINAHLVLAWWLRDHRDDLAGACRSFERAARLADRRGEYYWAVQAYTAWAETERMRGNLDEARAKAVTALDRAIARDTARQTTWTVEVVAHIAADLGETALACRLIGAAEQSRIDLANDMPAWDVPGYRRDRALLSATAGDRFDGWHEEGRAWSIADAAQRARDTLAAFGAHLAS